MKNMNKIKELSQPAVNKLREFCVKGKALIAGVRQGRLSKIIIAAVVALLLLLGLAGFQAYSFMHGRGELPGKLVVLEIKPGDSFDQVAAALQQSKVISSKTKFKLLAMLRGETGHIQAGVFEFSTAWTPSETLNHLVYGKPTLQRLTLREGLPWWEVGRLIEAAGLAKAEDFKEIIHDPGFLKKMGIPFKSAEGFLYPDTYFLRKPINEPEKKDAERIASRLVNTFWQKGQEIWGNDKPLGQDLRELVIMASLVEKETGIADERAKVAGVYANRMQKGMLLQCDPTIIYGLGPSFKGSLRRSHLQDASNPYNTYQHAGLPPGPICSPGAAALKAAFQPEEHDYFYFVATGRDGTHYFNKNLQGHNRDVAKYLKELRSSRQAAKQTGPATAEASAGKAASLATPLANATDAAGEGVSLEIVEAELALSQNATTPNSKEATPKEAPGKPSAEALGKQAPAEKKPALVNATNATIGESAGQTSKLQTVNGTKAINSAKAANATKEETAKPAPNVVPNVAPSGKPGAIPGVAATNSTK